MENISETFDATSEIARESAIEEGTAPADAEGFTATSTLQVDSLATDLEFTPTPFVGEAKVEQLYSYETPASTNDLSIADPAGLLDGMEIGEQIELLESTCGCDTCIEDDSDDFKMLHDMYTQLEQRVAKLEARIEAHNIRASHKI